jgi:hypothetical protein
MNSSTITTHQDKGGMFRSVDRETFRKLRRVRFFSHVSRIQASRYERWSRKEPQNRVRWVFNGFDYRRSADRGFAEWKAEPWAMPEQCPISLSTLQREYESACLRHDNPEKVVSMRLDPQALEDMLKALYDWSDRVYGHRQ